MSVLKWVLIGLVLLGLVLELVGKGGLVFDVAAGVTLVLLLAGVA